MAMLPGDYKRRVVSTTKGASVNSGYADDPVHIPGGSTNFEICPAGSVITVFSINVTSSSGVNEFFMDANGNKQEIMAGVLVARDYKQHFYCPWPLYASTDVDCTAFVAPPAKGATQD